MSDLLEQVEKHFGQRILEVVRDGEVAMDKTGAPVLDGEGNPVRTCPSAAMMGVVRQWIKEQRQRKPKEDDPLDAVQKAIATIQQARQEGDDELPPLDTDSDDAAT